MEPTPSPLIVLDFDGTMIRGDSLEELVYVVLRGRLDRDELRRDVGLAIDMAMTGKGSYLELLTSELKTLTVTRRHVEEAARRLEKTRSPSLTRLKRVMRAHHARIHVVTRAPLELVLPVVEALGIPEGQIHANRLLYTYDGRVAGLDPSCPLASPDPLGAIITRLGFPTPLVVVGDGLPELSIDATVQGVTRVAYTEHTRRDVVVAAADHEAGSMEAVFSLAGLTGEADRGRGSLKALALEGIHADAVARLAEGGVEVDVVATSLTEAALVERIRGVQLLCLRSKTAVTEAVLQAADELLAIGAFCIGTDNIALPTAAHRGVAVFNAPYSNTRSVVELAIASMITLLRKVAYRSAQLHQGMWNKTAKGSFEVRGKRLGIIGYGNIGSQLSVLAESLGLDVYYYDIVDRLALGNATPVGSLDELLGRVDIVSIHVDGREDNRNLIGARELRLMRDNVIFVNTSRGSVVDLDALAAAIQSGKVQGAAVDVFPTEPLGTTNEFTSVLQHLPNVILTPHIGGSTEEAQRNIGHFVADKLLEYVTTGSTFSSVNFPALQLPSSQGSCRLVHIHDNVPGVLAKLNQVFAEASINIVGQHLKTNEEIGYVVTDVSGVDQGVVDAMADIPHTIKVRTCPGEGGR